MSRDGVNQVKPDEEQIHQQDLRASLGPVDVPRHGSHTPQRLEVKGPHPDPHEELAPLLEGQKKKRDPGTGVFRPDSTAVGKSSTSALGLPPVLRPTGQAACSSVTPAGWTGPC